MSFFKSEGGSLDGWAGSGGRENRRKMCEAITKAEDQLELETHGRWNREHPEVRELRRKLERELWP